MTRSKIPDVIGNRERAQQAHSMLKSVQFQIAQLEAVQLMEGLGDDEKIPNSDPEVTFAEQCAKLDRQVERITSKYAHLMPAVQKLAEREERLSEEEDARIDRLTAEERAAERRG